MEISFDNQVDNKYDFLEDPFLKLMEITFSYLGIKQNYEVDVSLVDESLIQQINRDYRGIDKITDVISFAFNDDKKESSQIKSFDVLKLLGEIFICIPRAIEQAKEIGNTVNRELLFLFTHGLLHLLGYDHMKEEDEKIMFKLQDEILDKFKEKYSYEFGTN